MIIKLVAYWLRVRDIKPDSFQYSMKKSRGKIFRATIIEVITVCPRSLDPLYIVIYNKKWAKTFWTYNTSKGGGAFSPSA